MPNYPLISELEKLGWEFINTKDGPELVKFRPDIIMREASNGFHSDLKRAQRKLDLRYDVKPWQG